MPILIKIGSVGRTVFSSPFNNEKELESILRANPGLLGGDDGPDIAFVSGQVILRNAGILDLLFVTSEGLPIVVEVKLARNGESRREVVAQAIDYLSSLAELTVDELDDLVGKSLEKALRQVVGGSDVEFDKAWTAVGTNLRNGRAQVIVALDSAPLALERIFRFLARNSNLDVKLLTVQRHVDPDGSEIFVPRLLVNPDSETGRLAPPAIKRTLEELLTTCENNAAVEFFTHRSKMPRDKHNASLVYEQAGKIHWYVGPTKTAARVTQIDRFTDDGSVWKSLSNPNIKFQKYESKDNLQFDLISPNDFGFFVQTVEHSPPKSWTKPQAKSESAPES